MFKRYFAVFVLSCCALLSQAQPVTGCYRPTTFDYQTGKEGQKAYLRLPRGSRQVKAILYCHQNMTEEVLFRSHLFCHKMDSLGVAMAFVQQGSQNWDVTVKDENGQTCQERFDHIIRQFA